MIGDGHGMKFEFVGLFHEAAQLAGAIEQGVLGVQMQMNKIGVRHDLN
jgi:hypothetical protein